MSVADKLLQLNQVKQDIKTAIETKGIPMTNVAFTEYANKILDISGGGGVVDDYFYYAKAYYTITNNSTLFTNAWDEHDKRETYFDEDLTFVMTNTDLGMPLSIYTGNNIDDFYDYLATKPDAINEAVRITVNGTIIFDSTNQASVNATGVSIRYVGDQSALLETPTPIYSFATEDNLPFMGLMDLSQLGFPLGKSIGFINNENITSLKIESGYNRYYENGVVVPYGIEIVPPLYSSGFIDAGDFGEFMREQNLPLVIPNSVTSIGDDAFYNWTSNNQPLVIPNSVTSIGNWAFGYWQSNNQPLVIPNSVTSIGTSAFRDWNSNNQPLVIPNSVTSIGDYAFYNWKLVPYVEIQAITPPTLSNINAFNNQKNAPIYVPDESVDDYKTATNWVNLASRIKPISEL